MRRCKLNMLRLIEFCANISDSTTKINKECKRCKKLIPCTCKLEEKCCKIINASESKLKFASRMIRGDVSVHCGLWPCWSVAIVVSLAIVVCGRGGLWVWWCL